MLTASQLDPSKHHERARIEMILTQNTRLALQIAQMRNLVHEEGRFTSHAATNETTSEWVDLQKDNERLSTMIKRQTQEIAALTRQLEAGESRAREDNLRRRLAEIEAYVAKLEDAHLRTLHSTSWRLTAPLRAVLRRVRGQASPEAFRARFLEYT